MKGKLYSLLIIVPVALFATLLVGLSFYLQPFYGDLTRLGGYPENLYGWNDPQSAFSESVTSYINQYDGAHVDYLIFGDSFSHVCEVSSDVPLNSCIQWTGYLKKSAGYHGLTFHHDKYSSQELVDKVKTLDIKPKFLVFQSVERYAVSRLQYYERQFGCESVSERQSSDVNPAGLVDLEESIWRRLREVNAFDLNAPVALIKHRLSKKQRSRVRIIDLDSDLSKFSSEEPNQLLVINEDFDMKSKISNEDIEQAACGLKAFSSYIQTELGIPVIYALTPDKTSVYQNWFADEQYKVPSIIPKLATDDVWYIDLHAPMIEAVKSGVKDVYLPNDTHWGANGAQIASNELIKLLDQMKASGK